MGELKSRGSWDKLKGSNYYTINIYAHNHSDLLRFTIT